MLPRIRYLQVRCCRCRRADASYRRRHLEYDLRLRRTGFQDCRSFLRCHQAVLPGPRSLRPRAERPGVSSLRPQLEPLPHLCLCPSLSPVGASSARWRRVEIGHGSHTKIGEADLAATGEWARGHSRGQLGVFYRRTARDGPAHAVQSGADTRIWTEDLLFTNPTGFSEWCQPLMTRRATSHDQRDHDDHRQAGSKDAHDAQL